MWPFNRERVTKRLNTVDLDPELGDVEFLCAMEEVFGVNISKDAAANLIKVGALHALILKQKTDLSQSESIWSSLTELLREHTGTKDPIDHETTFFPKFAKERGRPGTTE